MQQHHPLTKTAAGVLALAILMLVFPAPSAWAAYTVIEDDLYPTAMIEARNNPAGRLSLEKERVGFTKGSSTLSPIAKASLADALEKMAPGVSIRILARIDSASGTGDAKQQGLALARGGAIRSYLVSQGVQAEAIRVEVDSAGNPQSAAGISVAEVQISRPAVQPAPVSKAARYSPEAEELPRSIPHQYRNLPQPEPVRQRVAAEPAAASTGHERTLQFINQAVQSGQMSPAVAAQIIRTLVESSAGAPAPMAQMAAPAPAPVYAQYTRPSRWNLEAGYSLKDNIDSWARASGWHPVIWEASNLFEITANRTLDGGFPDVLRLVADSTGLNICANPRERTVKVTDRGVACNK